LQSPTARCVTTPIGPVAWPGEVGQSPWIHDSPV